MLGGSARFLRLSGCVVRGRNGARCGVESAREQPESQEAVQGEEVPGAAVQAQKAAPAHRPPRKLRRHQVRGLPNGGNRTWRRHHRGRPHRSVGAVQPGAGGGAVPLPALRLPRAARRHARELLQGRLPPGHLVGDPLRLRGHRCGRPGLRRVRDPPGAVARGGAGRSGRGHFPRQGDGGLLRPEPGAAGGRVGAGLGPEEPARPPGHPPAAFQVPG
mmetsp:Transcript_5350/g.9302  ORF Transcript_5350/g.9302 Transcript_5350/m.9302 type:complete len:217 (+) Transcript_5350:291-941(+)